MTSLTDADRTQGWDGWDGDEPARRICVDRLTPAELAIRAAVEAVEALPGDVRLTDAVALLGKARESVADYVDGVPRTETEEERDERLVRETAAALADEIQSEAGNGPHGQPEVFRWIAGWLRSCLDATLWVGPNPLLARVVGRVRAKLAEKRR